MNGFDFGSFLVPVLVVGGLALFFGVILGLSARKFAVQADPNVERLIKVLPGVNCGGCGFPGCAGFAQGVVKGKATYNGCAPGGLETAQKIAQFMGVEATAESRKVAFVKCNGDCDAVKMNYIYDGPRSCVSAAQLATGGSKGCQYSCIGHGSCENICPFGAIDIVDTVAVINSEKCTACGKCVSVCPKNLIEIVPDSSKVRVACNSKDKGRTVRDNCRNGCIGCTICEKTCQDAAITVVDNLSRIDYEKCTQCKACVAKCPTKVIKVLS
ncbi:MAG: RnfABCDGE type electron transport complex subunit B [Treponema sp.]|nr:RnfABCDGE type electron transport complex subunit B [Treponema sp.]